MSLFDIEMPCGAPGDAALGPRDGGAPTVLARASAVREHGSGSEDAHGVCITVKELTYSIKAGAVRSNGATSPQFVQLLHGVTGYFEPGCMAALMGPSGCGKTTCLDLIAGRKNTGQVSGEIRYGGAPPGEAFLRRCVGYVEQSNTLLPILSVEEMLMYTCQLKRARQEPWDSKSAAVEELISKLNLGSCRGTRIGDPLHKGISGGEAKRTSIAVELISNPRALLLDEPTSGLDSFTANEVLDVLKGLAKGGVTILATVHSPTSYGFALFDSLMVLLRGRAVYFGPSGRAALDYVAGLPAAAAAPRQPGVGDAEWLVDVVSRLNNPEDAEALAGAYRSSREHEAAEEAVKCFGTELATPVAVTRELRQSNATVTPWWWGLAMLFKYRTLRNLVTPSYLMSHLALHIVFTLMMVTLYLGTGKDLSMLNVPNIAGALCMWSAVPAFGAIVYCPVMVLERPLFIRERHGGLYGTGTYLLSRVVEEVLVAIPPVAVASVAAFYGIQFQGSVLIFGLVYFSVLCTGIATAFAIAAGSPTMDVANMALPTLYGTSMFFAGFMLRFDDIPGWWYWYSRLNPLRYSFTAAILNQFLEYDPPFIGAGTVLKFYGVKGQSAIANVCYQSIFVAFFLTLAWSLLSFKTYTN